MAQVLILDANQRSALAATRSLGRLGVTVHVADSVDRPLAGASRFAASVRLSPNPLNEPTAFANWVLATTQAIQPAAILPLTDVSTMLLNPVRDALAPARVMCAPLTAYELVSDKSKLVELARRIGVRVPQTVTVDRLEALEQALPELTFPLVLKPARSRVLLAAAIAATAVVVVRSAREAREYLRTQSWFGTCPCLLQEYIPGEGAGVFAFYDRGKPLAWFAHRRLREKPPSGGVSVLSQSVDVDPHLLAASERILSAANWHGAAMVEFKLGHDGFPYLMEVNGRLWGSLQLAIDSGVDFPAMLYLSALGSPIERLTSYKKGQKLRWWLGDLDNLAIQLRDPQLNKKTKLGAIMRFLAASFDFSCKQEILRWSDPLPAFRELRGWLGALL